MPESMRERVGGPIFSRFGRLPSTGGATDECASPPFNQVF
jgi:hypothetical protein